mmetsp:Transcript_25006/g.32577  ORF Transcript_25006/g.32577 Transcript_25006/m.32577 type:complete len:152 (+) Transcript_25006:56-511(+)
MLKSIGALRTLPLQRGLQLTFSPMNKFSTHQIPMRYGVTSEIAQELSEPVKRVLSLDNASRSEVTQVRVGQAIKAFQIRPGDTGSTPCQIAGLAVKIQALQTHMKKHRKDNTSKRGLEAMLTKQRKLLLYLKRKDFDMYRTTITSLKLVPV